MTRLLVMHARLVGGLAGLIGLLGLELLALWLRQAMWARFSAPPSLIWPLFAHLGLFKALLFGVPLGQSCGFAAAQWFEGDRALARATLHRTALVIVLVHALLFPLAFPLTVIQSFDSATPFTAKAHQLIEWCLANFLLQIGVFLWMLSRALPDKATPIREEARS